MYLKYLRVTVPYYMPIAVLGLLLGAVLTTGSVPDIRILYAALSLCFLVGGFNTFNGVYDYRIDKINKPDRPIASGKMTQREGLIYSMVLYVISFLLSVPVGIHFIIIVILSIVITSSYSIPSVFLRGKFIINTLTGLVFYGILCPLAGWSLYPHLPVPVPLIFFIFVFGSGIAITKDFQDIHGDSVYRIKTVPTVMGISKALALISSLIVFSFVYMILAYFAGIVDIKYLSVFIFVPWAVYAVRGLDSKNNDKVYFMKNMLLAISVELLIIIVTLI
ncbi:MAG: UbiA family prenyltransferase [Candidatus Aenigmarchaeota archaeon]|nr:UbiA family prenyltransferase [Candidatus Aenigmarchaeota archaeon]